jgi:hypothetical protein
MVKLSDIQLLSLSATACLPWPTPAVCLSLLKTLYGLKQSGMICRNALVAHLAKHATMQMQLYPLSSRMLRETRCSSS